jgi:histone deacetylase complex regulatory component SIN3
MLISDIIDQLQELRAEIRHLAKDFKINELDYSGCDAVPFSDAWYDYIQDNTGFVNTDTEYYSFFTFIANEEDELAELEKAKEYLKDPEILSEFQENFETYISDVLTVEQAVENTKRAWALQRQITGLASEHNLPSIGFETDLFLGFDYVYYESSRCW